MKIILGVLIVTIITIGGFIIFKQYAAAPTPEEAVSLYEVSFMCADNTHFIGEFTDAGTLRIIVDGETLHELARIPGDGQRYGDSDHLYVFAGEEATVTVHGTPATTCTQPFDQNNAPFNFGDAGEGGGEPEDIVGIVREGIIGSWQSVDDPLFLREFRTDMALDHYEGAVTATSSWTVMTAQGALTIPYPLEDDAIYLVLTEAAGDDLYFRIVTLTPQILEMMPLGQGGILRFTFVE